VIVLLVHQVDGDAGLLLAGGQDGLVHAVPVHPLATVLREEGRVHVDDAATVSGESPWPQPAEIAGQDDEIRPMPIQRAEDRRVQPLGLR